MAKKSDTPKTTRAQKRQASYDRLKTRQGQQAKVGSNAGEKTKRW